MAYLWEGGKWTVQFYFQSPHFLFRSTAAVKKSWFILSNFYCPPGDQKPLEKQAFGLESVSTVPIITNHDEVITNCDGYYKLRHLLQITTEQTS